MILGAIQSMGDIGVNQVTLLIAIVTGLVTITQAYFNKKRDVTIAKIKADTIDQEREIENLNEELKRERKMIEVLEKRISENDKDHKEMIAENSNLRERVSKLEGTIKIMAEEIERKEKTIQNLSAKNT